MTACATPAPEQLALALPHLAALGAEDFLVSQSNAQAAALIEAWPRWPAPSIAVIGPHGAGKTHLANVWRSKSGASVIAGSDLTDRAVPAFEQGRALVVEDIDRGIASERILFHILNLAREHRLGLMITARTAPGELEIALPDLRSRLRALPIAVIEAPDEVLLKAVLVKLFADRQLNVEPHVVNFLALHLERSMEALGRVVAETDRLALARQRKVTRALAQEALEALGSREGT